MDSEAAHTLKKKLILYEREKKPDTLKGRKVNSVTKTFHKVGIVVPYDSKTDVGYRPLSESESMLLNQFFSLFIM